MLYTKRKIYISDNMHATNTIDFLKVIATFLVVMVHTQGIFATGDMSNNCLEYIMAPVIAFARTGVPLFFSISGYLLFTKPLIWKENLKKKIKSLVIPYLFWNALWIMVWEVGNLLVGTGFDNAPSWSAKEIGLALFGIPFWETPFYPAFWYIRELFILNIVAPIMRKIILKWPIPICISLMGIWLFPMSAEFYYIRNAVVFFGVGGILAFYPVLLSKLQGMTWRWGICSCILGICMSYVEYSCSIQCAFSVLCYIFSIYLFCHYCCKEKALRVHKVIDYVKNHIFIVYATHNKLTAGLISLAIFRSSYIGFRIVEFFLISGGVIGLCIIFSELFLCVFPNLYKIVTGRH